MNNRAAAIQQANELAQRVRHVLVNGALSEVVRERDDARRLKERLIVMLREVEPPERNAPLSV